MTCTSDRPRCLPCLLCALCMTSRVFDMSEIRRLRRELLMMPSIKLDAKWLNEGKSDSNQNFDLNSNIPSWRFVKKKCTKKAWCLCIEGGLWACSPFFPSSLNLLWTWISQQLDNIYSCSNYSRPRMWWMICIEIGQKLNMGDKLTYHPCISQ